VVEMVVLFTVLGLSEVVPVNTVWILLDRGVSLSKVIVVTSETIPQGKLSLVKSIIREDLGVSSVDHLRVPEVAVDRIVNLVKGRILREKESGERVLVDVTGGRKTMSIACYKAGIEAGCEVIYVHLRDQEYLNVLYPLIPRHKYSLVTLYEPSGE